MLLKWLMTQNYTAKATKEFRKAKKLFNVRQSSDLNPARQLLKTKLKDPKTTSN